jgi:hypothetical protein
VSSGLVLILVGAYFVLGSSIAEMYVLEVQGRPLEREFGFRAAYVTVSAGRSSHRVFTLTEVAVGGVLERSGFRAGDRPSVGFCLFQGDYVAAKAFFDRLEQVRAGAAIQFTVANPEDGEEWRRLTLRR